MRDDVRNEGKNHFWLECDTKKIYIQFDFLFLSSTKILNRPYNDEILSCEDETDADRKVSSRAFDRRRSRLHTIKSRYFMDDSIFSYLTRIKKRTV